MKHISIFKSHNDLFQSKAGKKSQKGQGMTEYLAATALIGVASIATLGYMGDTLQNQFAAMSAEIGGEDGGTQREAAKDAAEDGAAKAEAHYTLQNFTGQNAGGDAGGDTGGDAGGDAGGDPK